jgi:hypothetical protein
MILDQICTNCKETKPLTKEFRERRDKENPRKQCKLCRREMKLESKKKRKKNNPEKYKEDRSKYNASDSKKLSQQKRIEKS